MRRELGLGLVGLAAGVITLGAGCSSPGVRARLTQQNEALRQENEHLKRDVAQRDGTITALHRRVDNLENLGPGRPAGLFAPVKLEIVRLSGGADYDGKPGDDGVTVYLRLRDADDDAVKAPGKIAVQLLDGANLANPRVLGVYRIEDPAGLREAWYGRFGTYHFTLRCPFPPGVELPTTGKVDVKAQFVDYLTGVTLTAMEEVNLHVPEAGRPAR